MAAAPAFLFVTLVQLAVGALHGGSDGRLREEGFGNGDVRALDARTAVAGQSSAHMKAMQCSVHC